MGKKKKRIIQEQTSHIVASKAGKLLSRKFTKELDGYLAHFMKTEKKIGKLSSKLASIMGEIDELESNYTSLLDEFQDFIIIKKEEIQAVAASALTQASGEVDGDGEGTTESDKRSKDSTKL